MSRKVGDVDYSKFILPVALVIGGVYIIKKLNPFSGGPTGAENSTLDANEKAANAATLQQLASMGQHPSASDAQLQGLASQLWSLGTSENSAGKASQSVQDQMRDAIESIVDNTADWISIKSYFGTKQAATTIFSTCYWLGTDCVAFNLDSFLQSALDEDHINDLNEYFQQQSIAYNL